MEDSVALLDTPKRKSLSTQADTLRLSLKEYERTFAAEHNGRKPSRNEIKANTAVAGQYKKYQDVRDVLSGKRGLDILRTPKRQTRTRHERTDSAISLTPHRTSRLIGHTPSKSQKHPNEIDPYDPPSSASPRVLPNAIGPTPRRDGMVLGIFDLLSQQGSGRSSQATPSSRKRKIDVVYNNMQDGAGSQDNAVTQTPSQKRRQSTQMGDQGPITATPSSRLATGKRNQNKTPISESKKFMLNHFFATPSAVRFSGMLDHAGEDAANTPMQGKTPLRDLVLGITPIKDTKTAVEGQSHVDATPPYLKRSFSFKDRLLSATADSKSKPTSSTKAIRRSLSGNLRHARSAPKPLSQIIADRAQAEVGAQDYAQTHAQQQPASQQRQQYHEGHRDDEDEDEMAALRELEANEVNILVEDSQFLETTPLSDDEVGLDADGRPEQREREEPEQPTRVWKKKGQKRTTRRVIMRPVRMKPAPKMKAKAHAGEDESGLDNDENEEEDEDENEVSRIEETQLLNSADPDDGGDGASDPDIEYLEDETTSNSNIDQHSDDDDENAFIPSLSKPSKKAAAKPKSKSKTNLTPVKEKSTAPESKYKDKDKNKSKKSTRTKVAEDEKSTKGRTINPNAYSHMNFRSLKIKNKNSKAKGAGRRFGRR